MHQRRSSPSHLGHLGPLLWFARSPCVARGCRAVGVSVGSNNLTPQPDLWKLTNANLNGARLEMRYIEHTNAPLESFSPFCIDPPGKGVAVLSVLGSLLRCAKSTLCHKI